MKIEVTQMQKNAINDSDNYIRQSTNNISHENR